MFEIQFEGELPLFLSVELRGESFLRSHILHLLLSDSNMEVSRLTWNSCHLNLFLISKNFQVDFLSWNILVVTIPQSIYCIFYFQQKIVSPVFPDLPIPPHPRPPIAVMRSAYAKIFILIPSLHQHPRRSNRLSLLTYHLIFGIESQVASARDRRDQQSHAQIPTHLEMML